MTDNYLPCGSYSGSAGFHRFFNEEDKSWYFALNNEKGITYLRSEGYSSEAACNNGIQSVIKNAPNDDRWVTGKDDEGHYFALRAGNNQEIARSCPYADEAVMLASLTWVKGPDSIIGAGSEEREGIRWSASMIAASKKEAAPAPVSNNKEDDYILCREYAERIEDSKSEKYPGFISFQHTDGKFYFGWLDDDGALLMRGEGYPTIGARDNGIESVMRNRDLEERYSVEQKRNAWFTVLKAGNHQEIARSCPYETEAAAIAIFPSEREKARAAKLAAAAPPVRVSDKLEDDYLICREYKERITDSKSEKYPGFISFRHDNGKYYFGWLDEEGELMMRGEGYPTTSARDNGIESVMRNRDLEERFSTEQSHGAWFAVLKAGNRQEIARSCPANSEAACLAMFPSEREKARAAKLAAAAPPPRVSDKVKDDYLPCEEYRKRISDSKSEKYPGFISFKGEDGNFYFAWLDEDKNDILMRGEGYPTSGARDNGIESVMRNRDLEERYSTEEVDGKWFTVLKAGNRQEIARSCPKDEMAAALAWFPGTRNAALAAAAAALAAAAAPVVVPKVVTPPPPPKVVQTAPPPPPPKVVQTAPPPPPVVESSGGFKWWWLLPLLLIPLFLWLRGCEGCKQPEAVTKVETPVTPPPVVDTVKKEEPPAPPPAATCACKGSENPIINIPVGKTPKALSRLGTNPEFGNSHGLDGTGFYDKIAAKASKSATDKRFLDGIFKAMGYANGFADAKPEMFSEVTLPVGTVGNMGYSPAHKTLYAQVPDGERDRLAFRIKSANGCDLHFMKTCGNHFFFCPN